MNEPDENGWMPTTDAPQMRVVWVFHPYYSHGRVRQAYVNRNYEWTGVNVNGIANYPYAYGRVEGGPGLPTRRVRKKLAAVLAAYDASRARTPKPQTRDVE